MSQDKPEIEKPDASRYAFAIAASRYNNALVEALLCDTVAELKSMGVADENLKIVRVPGAGELPHACNLLAESDYYDAVIALGVVVKGATPHFEVIANSTANALQHVAIATTVPVVNGIIVANTRAQAVARTTGKLARGAEFARTAAEMARVAGELLDDIENEETTEGLN